MAYAQQIAIDGGAGAGKTTLGKKLAELLKTHVYLDAGALYRTITHWALKRKVDLDDVEGLTSLASELRVVVRPPLYIRINDQPLGAHLYTPRIDSAVPFISRHLEVRLPVRRIQHAVARQHPVIFSGRDIGSVVLPDAEAKIYLSVSLEERVRRQMYYDNGLLDAAYFTMSLAWRDEMDSTRPVSPLCQPAGALRIEGDDLDTEGVLAAAMTVVKKD